MPWKALGFCHLVIRGVKVSEQCKAFDTLPTPTFSILGTMPGGASHPPPPNWGSICWLWVGTGIVKARVRRTEESYPSCRPFSLWYTLTCPPYPFALSKHVLVIFLLSSLCWPKPTHTPVSSYKGAVPHVCEDVPCTGSKPALSLFPGSTAASASENSREWTFLIWRQEDTTSSFFPNDAFRMLFRRTGASNLSQHLSGGCTIWGYSPEG